jgi:hypothetical protein
MPLPVPWIDEENIKAQEKTSSNTDVQCLDPETPE